MSADVIEFPRKKENQHVSFSINYATINGQSVPKPKNGKEYLELCKKFLDPDDYQDVLCSIMDEEHYDAMEEHIHKLVKAYFSFKK